VSSLPISVLKFGSSVLRSPRDLGAAVHEIYRELREARRVVAIVSAFGRMTDRLLESARRISDEPSEHALALFVSTGELQAVASLAIALERAGVPSVAMDASRAGIAARGSPLDAQPCGLDVRAIERELDRGAVVVLPGFIGRDANGSACLFGRGGSDLSALFVARELGARTCRLLKDVDGVYDRDPAAAGERARRFAELSFADARAIGGRIVQEKALRFAEDERVELEVGACGSLARTRVSARPSALVASHAKPRPLRVGLLGLGTVGLGVYRELARDRERFSVQKILVKRRTLRGRAGVPSRLLTTEANAVLDARCDVIVEVLGGVETASALVDAALERGISVVSANKAAIVAHGARWRELAALRGAQLVHSAAVGGSVPMLEVVERLARERRIVALEGVLNATTNFVLDLVAGGLDLESAVARARELGYCEANPRTDLDGTDAAHKLELLARVAFGTGLPLRWIEREGIEKVRKARANVRLVASCRRASDGIEARLALRELDASHSLASVRGAGNALVVTFDDGDPIVLAGQGAGRFPTTESVLGDLLELARSPRTDARVHSAAS
jgi:homoserine dehydrogenase